MCQKMKKLNNRNNIYIIIALQFALLFLLFNPLSNYEVTSFKDRIMGESMMANIDVSKRVNNLYGLVFGIIPISVLCFYKILKKVLDKTNTRNLKFMELISVLSIINTVLAFTNKLQKSEVLLITVYILNAINIFIILNVSICKLFKKEFNFKNIKWALISAIPIAFILTLVLHKLNITIISININWLSSYIIGVILLLILISLKSINKEILKKAYIIFLIAPLLEMIYLEAYNVLNQYNIILVHKIKTIVSIYGICMLISIIYYFINCKKKIVFRYTKVYYPIILITFGAIIAALTMTTTVDTDFFESANHGLGIYEFFRYGKIPLIETFDAHMLSNQVFGIIYGYFNNDIIGAAFSIYNSYKQILYCIILYCLLKNIFSRDTAFLITVFFPFSDGGINTYYIAFIAVITLLNAIKNKKFTSYLWYWTSLVVLCVWQLDIGYSISIATVMVLIYTLIKDRKKTNINIKNIIIPCIIVIATFLIFYVGVCLVKDINPITRAIEFLKLAMSNVNWGKKSIGKSNSFAYIFCYYIMPIVIAISIIYIFYKKIKMTRKNVILLVLALFYILNIQRGIVRHSLVENTNSPILSFSLIYIAIFMIQYYKNNVKTFLVTYVSLILLSNLIMSTNIKIHSNVFENSINKYVSFKIQDEGYNKKQRRVKLSERMEKEYKDLKIVVDELMDENETYLDFTNQTLLYALLDKEKVVYVNQSPGLLSGEMTQIMFLDEIENSHKDVKIVLKAKNKQLSNVLDGILNDYRYYLVSEYIYKNYMPLVSVDGYDIWVMKENYSDMIEKINQIGNDRVKIINDEYIVQDKNVIDVGYIAYAWGEYDKKQEERIIEDIETNLDIKEEKTIQIKVKEEDKQNGNVLRVKINSKEDTKVSIKLYENEEMFSEYTFVAKKGVFDYVIRCSTTYAWYQKDINKLQIKSDLEAKLIEMYVLEANTIKEYK